MEHMAILTTHQRWFEATNYSGKFEKWRYLHWLSIYNVTDYCCSLERFWLAMSYRPPTVKPFMSAGNPVAVTLKSLIQKRPCSSLIAWQRTNILINSTCSTLLYRHWRISSYWWRYLYYHQTYVPEQYINPNYSSLDYYSSWLWSL